MSVQYASKDPVRWRINIIISSRDLARIMEPVICLEITMESGEKQCIEMPVSKYHVLRQNIALLLKEIDGLKTKISQTIT